MGDYINRDKNVFNRSIINGNVGGNNPINLPATLDYTVLNNQLAELIEALNKKAHTPKHGMSIAFVMQAETAAQAKDGKTVAERLKAAGEWAFKIATDIGVGLVVELMKANGVVTS